MPTTGLPVELLRYLVVGGGAFVVDFGTLALLNKALGIHYLVAAAAAFAAGLAANYVGSTKWVFAKRKVESRGKEVAIFALVGVIGLGVNELVLYGTTGVLGIDPLIGKIASAAIVLAWNFGARKLLLF